LSPEEMYPINWPRELGHLLEGGVVPTETPTSRDPRVAFGNSRPVSLLLGDLPLAPRAESYDTRIARHDLNPAISAKATKLRLANHEFPNRY
jgi:hypothetical protein